MWKKLALVLLTLLLIAGGVMFYLWRQVTALPEWYSEELAAGPEAVSVAPPRPQPAARRVPQSARRASARRAVGRSIAARLPPYPVGPRRPG